MLKYKLRCGTLTYENRINVHRDKLTDSTKYITGGKGNLHHVTSGLCLPRHVFEWSRYEDFSDVLFFKYILG